MSQYASYSGYTSGGGGGGVTSVGLADGSSTPIFNISGSPVTGSGTLTETLKTQTANTVLAGPTTGSAAQPTFRALVAADLGPTMTPVYNSSNQIVLNDNGETLNPSSGIKFTDPINRELYTGGGSPVLAADISSLLRSGGVVWRWDGANLDASSNIISNVVDPVSAQDAATKNYVDTHGGGFAGDIHVGPTCSTQSSVITATSYANYSNSPTLTFTPSQSGTYNVSAVIALYCDTNADTSFARVQATAGAPTLTYSQTAYNSPSAGIGADFVQVLTYAIYVLTGGVSYSFDLQGKTTSGIANNYMTGGYSSFSIIATRIA